MAELVLSVYPIAIVLVVKPAKVIRALVLLDILGMEQNVQNLHPTATTTASKTAARPERTAAEADARTALRL